jgi:hypothetical protein
MFEKIFNDEKVNKWFKSILIYLYVVKLMHIAHIIFMHLFS